MRLYYHPFSNFCQKALIALYEKGIPFEPDLIDLRNPDDRARLEAIWPMVKFPVLRDEARGVTVPEASLIIEYLDQHYPGPARLVPEDADFALRARLFDRVFDNYVSVPVQKIVGDAFRPEGRSDPEGVEQARQLLRQTYRMLDEQLRGGEWAVGTGFSLADCSAAPALFYAKMLVPFDEHKILAAYYERLRARPSFARAVDEARPYRPFFPLPWPADHD